MNRRPLVLTSALVLLSASPFACGDDSSNVGGASSSSSVVTAAATTSVASHASATSGGDDCTGLGAGFEASCGDCLELNCCGPLAVDGGAGTDPDLVACAQDMCNAECFPVTPPPFDLQCTVPDEPGSAGSCIALGGAITCNPVTNEGCTGAGAACDINQTGFQCYADGNTQDLCEACSNSDGFCKAGGACLGQCARYCCSDADCLPGHCVKVGADGNQLFPQSADLGACAMGSSSTTSSSSSSGGGGGGGGGGGATSASSSSSSSGSTSSSTASTSSASTSGAGGAGGGI